MAVLICPQGHKAEDNTRSSTNTGVFCITCAQIVECSDCGHVCHSKECEWIGSQELYRRTERGANNWKDGGVYGMCPACGLGPVARKHTAWWITIFRFLADGGKRT